MNTDDFMHALTLWREAAGEGERGMHAVSNVIRKRAQKSGRTIYEEITRHRQFSAVTAPGDRMLHRYPAPDDREWLIAQKIAETEDLEDITGGATHYFNPRVVTPPWDFSKMRKLVSIGRHDFYIEV